LLITGKDTRTTATKYYTAKDNNCEEHFPNKSTLCFSLNPLWQEYFLLLKDIFPSTGAELERKADHIPDWQLLTSSD